MKKFLYILTGLLSFSLCMFAQKYSNNPSDYAALSSRAKQCVSEAEAGDRLSQFILAKCLINGAGIEKDADKGYQWLQYSAQRGYINANLMVGYCMLNGIGVEKNITLAKEVFTTFALQGSQTAIVGLRMIQAEYAEQYVNAVGSNRTALDKQIKSIETTISQGERKAKSMTPNEASKWLSLETAFNTSYSLEDPKPKEKPEEKVYQLSEVTVVPKVGVIGEMWVQKNIIYPVEAMEKGLQGMVEVSFVVEKDGTRSNIKVTKSIDPLLDNEIVRIIKEMPKWWKTGNDGNARCIAYARAVFKLPKKIRKSRNYCFSTKYGLEIQLK